MSRDPNPPTAANPFPRSTWNDEATAEHRLVMAGWLAGFMAHEVNNHLAAALLELELALERPHSASTNELLARLHVAVESAGEVCRSTLGLLRPSSDNGAPGLLGDAIDRTLACLGRLRDRVVVEVPEECRLVATPLSLPRMQQVLLNALLNALQASPGKVFVAAQLPGGRADARSTANGRKRAGSASDSGRPAATSVEIVIEDNGPGLPESVLAQIQSTVASQQHSGQGGGFGIAILQRLVVEAGGIIRAESASPCGTRLAITLPTAARRQSRAA